MCREVHAHGHGLTSEASVTFLSVCHLVTVALGGQPSPPWLEGMNHGCWLQIDCSAAINRVSNL